jgi:radical SAM superfamily enzyme YgiQ (UPF0313 family)
MIGYPWESYEMAKKTAELAKQLFNEGSADTLQATIVMPYPNTPLFKECLLNGWLEAKPGEWEKFDMRQKIIKSPLTEEQIKELTSSFYRLFFKPKYIFNQFAGIRSFDDISYITRGFSKVVGKHLRDFAI